MIIGLGIRFGVSPLGTLGHANGVPSRGINPQTIKEIASSPKTPTLQGLKTQTYPTLKNEACPVVTPLYAISDADLIFLLSIEITIYVDASLK
jgi:hypothetical protein